MTRGYTLDASALLAWLQGQPHGARVANLLSARGVQVHLSVVALAEALVVIERVGGTTRATESLAAIRDAGILVVPLDEAIALASRELRLRYRLNTADAFIAATAAATRTVLLTSDSDYQSVSRKVSVEFLRPPPAPTRT